jgi:hypothetical protein
MWMTLFNIARPFIQSAVTKRAAEQAANYLNQRREQRLQPQPAAEPEAPADIPVNVEEVAELPACVPVEPVVVYRSESVGFSGSDVFWFTLSGFFFGGAIGIVVAYVTRKQGDL